MKMRLRWLGVVFGVLLGLAGTVSAAWATELPSVGLAPVLSTPTMSGSSVRLSWVDRSTHEDAFAVIRRWSDGQQQNVSDAGTGDKAGTGGVVTFVDTAPNSVPGGVGLLCYQVWAYDYDALFEISMSQDLCVNGALDPYDSQTYAKSPKIPAPSLDSVQLAGTQVTVKWTDRAVDEDGFRIYRRDASVPNWLASHNSVVGTRGSTNVTGVGQSYTFVDTLPTGTGSHRWCYYVADDNTNTPSDNPSNEKCTKALPTVGAPAPGLGTISTPDIGAADQSRITGEAVSVAIGTDGLPLIAYLTIGRGGSGVSVDDLMVAHCADVNCTSTTSITTIDAPGNVGWFPSMKIGSDGLGIIAYVAYSNSAGFLDDLRVAHCVDVACTSATITTLDAPSLVDAKPSLAIASDGLPTIGYQDDTGQFERFPMSRIKVIHCADIACTSAATTRTIDTVPSNGGSRSGGMPGGVSIAFSPTGLLHLTYLSGFNVLKIVTCSDPTCTFPSIFVVDQFPGADTTGWFPSLAIGRDGLPLISYFRDGGLTVAHCVNAACSGVTATTVDVRVNPPGCCVGGGKEDTIAIGADGLGVISYYDSVNLNLKVAHCTDLVCGAATTTTIDEFGDTGKRTALTIGADGLPIIAYLGVSENTMKVAHCPNSACTGEFTVPFITGNH